MNPTTSAGSTEGLPRTAPVIALNRSEVRRVTAAMALAYALLACSLSAQVALPEIRRTIPMSDVVTSLHGSFFGWALLGGGLFGSSLIGIVGRSRILAGGVVGMAVGAALFGTGHVVAQTLAGAALTGACGAAVVITIPGLVADVYADRRSEVFTRLNVVPAVLGLIFPLAVAAAPSVSLNWRWPTIVFPVVLLAAIVGVGSSLRNDGRAARETKGSTGAKAIMLTLRVEAVRRRFALQVLAVTLEFGFAVWLVTYLREVVGLSRDRAPLGAAMWALGMFFGRALVPQLVRSFGRRLEAACFSGAIVGGLLLIFGHWSGARFLAVPLVAFSLAPMYTLGVERMFIRGNADATNTANLSSLAAVASGLAITVGPLLMGVVGDIVGLGRAMLFVPVAAAVGLALCLANWGDEAGRLGQPT